MIVIVFVILTARVRAALAVRGPMITTTVAIVVLLILIAIVRTLIAHFIVIIAAIDQTARRRRRRKRAQRKCREFNGAGRRRSGGWQVGIAIEVIRGQRRKCGKRGRRRQWRWHSRRGGS